ncbi:hypothetical protein E2320_010105 [Naja naja]|nr:hypothetical protein E2320_010105 [Naja naja]
MLGLLCERKESLTIHLPHPGDFSTFLLSVCVCVCFLRNDDSILFPTDLMVQLQEEGDVGAESSSMGEEVIHSGSVAPFLGCFFLQLF